MSTMGRSHRSHYSQNYYASNDRPYFTDRPYYTTERTVYTTDRPGLYGSERQLYYGNGLAVPPRPPTERSQVIIEHKKPKVGSCLWILACVFTIFIIVVVILLLIFFTWGKAIEDKAQYDRTHQ